MKKLLQFVSATVVTLALGFAPSVSAASCSITTTGPNSNNTCSVTGNTTVTVTCVNGVTVTNLNNQSALSGTATVSGNTVSGNATSGDAANLNTAATQLAQNCAPAATTSTTTPTTTPVAAGGQGAGNVQAATKAQVAALPNTGPNTLLVGIATTAAVVTSVAGAAHVALGVYRRRAFKA